MATKEDFKYKYLKYGKPLKNFSKTQIVSLCKSYFGEYFGYVERNDILDQFDIYIKGFIINKAGNRVIIDKVELDIFKKKFEPKKWIVHVNKD